MRKLIASGAAVVVLAAGGVGAALAMQSAATTKVTEKEFKVTPVPAKVKAGKVTFSVKNVGHLEHEFIVVKTSKPASKLPVKGATAVVTGKVGALTHVKPGSTKTLTLALKAGHYVLLCNLPGHYKAGQYANFTVG
jgi:uncharacterized cupredoxin-like copper-binding protein